MAYGRLSVRRGGPRPGAASGNWLREPQFPLESEGLSGVCPR